jgi:hypothetical protein
MRHQVGLHGPRRRIIPVGKRANRHAAPHSGRGRRATTRSSSRLSFDLLQRSVDSRRAGEDEMGSFKGDTTKGQYAVFTAEGEQPEPEWPDRSSFQELLKLGFGENVVFGVDDAVVRRELKAAR